MGTRLCARTHERARATAATGRRTRAGQTERARAKSTARNRKAADGGHRGGGGGDDDDTAAGHTTIRERNPVAMDTSERPRK